MPAMHEAPCLPGGIAHQFSMQALVWFESQLCHKLLVLPGAVSQCLSFYISKCMCWLDTLMRIKCNVYVKRLAPGPDTWHVLAKATLVTIMSFTCTRTLREVACQYHTASSQPRSSPCVLCHSLLLPLSCGLHLLQDQRATSEPSIFSTSLIS